MAVVVSIIRSILDRILLVLLIGTIYLVAQMAMTQSCAIEDMSPLWWTWVVCLGVDLIFSVVSYVRTALEDWEVGSTFSLVIDLLTILGGAIVGFSLRGSSNSLIAENCWLVALLVYHISGSILSVVSEVVSTVEHVDDFDE